MKNFIIIALVMGLCSIVQGQTQEDELANLKKQVSVLKNKNAKLEKNVTDLKSSMKNMDKNVMADLNELNSKLMSVSDSLKAKEKIIMMTRHKTRLLLLSNKHRKKLLVFSFFAGIIIFSAISFFALIKYKKDARKQEEKLSVFNNDLKAEIKGLEKEIQTQLNSTKEVLEQKIKELDKKINELRK